MNFNLGICFLVVLGGSACARATGPESMSGYSSMGATQGGLQGMRLVRHLIAKGIVPPADAFTVEGMFSEHDLPLEGLPCSETLCLRTGVGVAPTLGEKPAAWLQIGFSSAIDPESYRRPPQILIAVVDVSGSMSREFGDDGTPGEVARQLLHGICERLQASDRVAIVTYNDVASVHLQVTPGDRQEAIKGAIDNLAGGGSTNMEAGLLLAYRLAREFQSEGRETRLVLLTDAQPNVGLTEASDFIKLAVEGAASRAYLTVIGLGVGMSPAVLSRLSAVRGANGFELFSPEDVNPFFEHHWPWFLNAIAFDLHAEVVVQGRSDLTLSAAYGFAAPNNTKTTLDLDSVFISEGRGGLLIEFSIPTTDISAFAFEISLNYTDQAGYQKNEILAVNYGGGLLNVRNQYFEQDSVGKAVALAILVSAMKKAAVQYGASPNAARITMQHAVERIVADVNSLNDPALATEISLAQDMLMLIEESAPLGLVSESDSLNNISKLD